MKDSGTTPTTIHVRRALAGDLKSRGWLVARWTPVFLMQARQHFVRAPSLYAAVEPEDLVAEMWRVWLEKEPRIDELGGRKTPVFRRYLAEVLAKICINVAKRRRLERGLPDRLALRRNPEGDPLDELIRSKVVRDVDESLSRIPPADRAVLVGRLLEGLPYRILAAAEGVTESALRQRFVAAKTRFAAYLDPEVRADFEDFVDDD